jgi:hypothetical protein
MGCSSKYEARVVVDAQLAGWLASSGGDDRVQPFDGAPLQSSRRDSFLAYIADLLRSGCAPAP